ncbi:MAG: lipopolysaccharide biosynthesis protein [Polaribacter sp.]
MSAIYSIFEYKFVAPNMRLFSFLKKEFVKNVLTLLTGSAFSQLIVYGAILILTRLFSEEVFGVYMLFSSTILILKPIASLQYELAIVLPKRDKDAINLFAFSIFIIFFFSLFLLGILILYTHEIVSFLKIQELSYFIYFVPLSVFFFGTVSVFDYWNNRTTLFKNISKGLIVKTSTMSITQIFSGFSSFSSVGLIPGLLVGQFFQLVVLIKLSLTSISNVLQHISIKRMWLLAKRYKDIPLFNTIISLTNNASNELPIFLITSYFGLGSAGMYGLAIKFARSPFGIVKQSVYQVFYNKATKIYNNNEDLHGLIKVTAKNLLRISVFLFIPILIVSFYLDILFGENWSEVGVYVRILIPWLLMAFLSYPLTSLILILNKQKTILFYDSLLLVFRFLAFYMGYTFYNDLIISLILFSGVGVIFNLFIFLYLFKISKEKKSASYYH